MNHFIFTSSNELSLTKKIIICFFIFFILPKGNAMNPEIISADYRLEVDLKKCAMDISINGLDIFSYYGNGPINTLIGVGEYLKSKGNKLKFTTWPSNNSKDIFDADSICNLTLKSRNRFEDGNYSDFFKIKYSPNENIVHNTSEKSINIIVMNKDWGNVSKKENIHHDSDNYYYEYTQIFDIINDFPEWKWVNSYKISDNIKNTSSLSQPYQALLESAYEEYWSFLQSKDLSKLKKIHSEMLYESVMANGGTIESYFLSLGLDETTNNSELELLPLKFEELEIVLDGRVIYMEPSPLRYLNKEKDTTLFISPKFRFDGNKFIVTR